MQSCPSSEYDLELDDDDIRQLDLVETVALAQPQPTPSTSSFPSIAQSIPTPSTSPKSLFQTTTASPSPTASRARTLPWQKSPANIPPKRTLACPKSPTAPSPTRTLPWQKSPTAARSQTTPASSANNAGQAVKGRSRPNEPPTHHFLDRSAAQTWIYPTNKSFRDYQFNIVQRALFDNILVSLPTGLGKTFIAAVIMYNFYRWFPKAKIVFVAPTKPLVAQQVDACFNVCGVPYSQTAELTGTVASQLRAVAYAQRRVFYMTPQTLANDLKKGLIEAQDIVCLVIDEAHRATGKYAYPECVALIRKTNPSFRVLALSATPGSSIEAVQNVIDACCIARVEIRIESSLDLNPFLHKRKNEVITVPLGAEITELRDLFVRVIQIFLDRVKNLNDYRLRDPLSISQFSVRQARTAFQMASAHANQAYKTMIHGNLTMLGNLGQGMSLLLYHGIQPFYEKLSDLKKECEGSTANIKRSLINDNNFQELMTRLKILVDNPNTVGHPKIERAASMIIDHFLRMADEKVDTRVMVFVQFRSSAAVLVKQLRRQEPIIKPRLFFGQSSDSRGGSGMKQTEQIEVVKQFKEGIFNVLVATSIGEEGLDIGDVDLIISYDASASPVRMLQRSGRTGRKREGHVVFLVTEGKEQRDHAKSLDAYETIQKKIASGKDFEFKLEESLRILPREFTPDCVRQWIRVPDEDKAALELKVERKRKGVKRKERDWSLPENVETGFVSGRVLLENSEGGENRAPSKSKGNRARSKAYLDDALDGSPSTPPPKARRLSSRNPNISPNFSTPKRVYRSFEEIVSSSGSEMGDLATELTLLAKKQEKGNERGKGKEVVTIDSEDSEYGLPSEFEETPRKRIRIQDFSEEE